MDLIPKSNIGKIIYYITLALILTFQIYILIFVVPEELKYMKNINQNCTLKLLCDAKLFDNPICDIYEIIPQENLSFNISN